MMPYSACAFQSTGVRFDGCRRFASMLVCRLHALTWRVNIRFMKKNLSSPLVH